MNKLVSINGVGDLPTPSDYQPEIEILEKSTRNAKGVLLREIIAYKTKLNCKWNYMNRAQYQKLLQIRRLKSFECSYYDPESNSSKTITCYCGPVKGTPIRTDENGVTEWKSITANFIEY